jgi:hypothetical protein
MSRGLGKLQREIMERLDHAETRPGSNAYDLRRLRRVIAGEEYGKNGAFQASFCRAVHGLINRGILQKRKEVVRPPGYYGGRFSKARVFYRTKYLIWVERG